MKVTIEVHSVVEINDPLRLSTVEHKVCAVIRKKAQREIDRKYALISSIEQEIVRLSDLRNFAKEVENL